MNIRLFYYWFRLKRIVRRIKQRIKKNTTHHRKTNTMS